MQRDRAAAPWDILYPLRFSIKKVNKWWGGAEFGGRGCIDNSEFVGIGEGRKIEQLRSVLGECRS